MKRPVLLLAALLLAGCGRWADLDSDVFAQDGVSREQFAVDNRACAQAAELERSYSLRGIQAHETDKHNLYSRAFVACMEARGYRARIGWYDFWEGYRL